MDETRWTAPQAGWYRFSSADGWEFLGADPLLKPDDPEAMWLQPSGAPRRFGLAGETSYGTPVAPTQFLRVEFDAE